MVYILYKPAFEYISMSNFIHKHTVYVYRAILFIHHNQMWQNVTAVLNPRSRLFARVPQRCGLTYPGHH